jgi:hypothetical protein
MQLKSIDSTGNRFLDGLSSSALDGLRPFESVQLRSGQNLHEPVALAGRGDQLGAVAQVRSPSWPSRGA